MSKLLNTMLKVADSGFESKAEVMMVSDYVKSDKKTLLDKEMVKNMNTASDTLNESFDRFDEKFKKLVLDEVKMVEKTKLFAQKAKDYTNQVGESMARIDKVLVKDFETKLDLLERYVKAMEALSDLNQKGFLTKLSQSIK